MAASPDKYARRRLRASYISVVVSISLVLFMLGLMGLVLLNTKRISDHVKERFQIQVILKDEVKEVDILKVQKTLDASHYVKRTEYVTKEEAAATLKDELGEDFEEFLGFNPLLASINVYLQADYAHPDSLDWIGPELKADANVEEVWYHREVLDAMNSNLRTLSLILLLFSALLFFIAIVLINSSIRLAIYSKRFLIRTMQLVGATSGFIQRPFIWRGIRQGVYGSIIAVGLVVGSIFLFDRYVMPEFFELQDEKLFLSLAGIILAVGVVISWLSTALAVRKYLRIKPDQLY